MKKIYINPGHSDRDPGAVGYETERGLNVKVSDFMRAYLMENFLCEVKSNPGTVGDLSAVCNEANDWGADLFVSIHFNAGGGDGYECYVYSEARRPLGEIFEKQVKAIGQNSRGVKVKSGFIVLNSTNMPAILNEGAFVDTKKDIEDWNEDAELKKLGEAYAKAAAEFLGLEKKVQPKSVYYVHYSTNIGPFDKQTADNLLAGLKAAGYTDAGITESKG
jgi:N-acetylmuramoyl-L-alanine amidase